MSGHHLYCSIRHLHGHFSVVASFDLVAGAPWVCGLGGRGSMEVSEKYTISLSLTYFFPTAKDVGVRSVFMVQVYS